MSDSGADAGAPASRAVGAAASRSTAALSGPRAPSSPATTKLLIAGLCLVAGLRVFVCAASFPFFGNMDEHAHVDLVWKFARGHWPDRTSEPFDHDSASLFVRYGTLEYVNPAARFTRGGPPAPLWTRSPEVVDRVAEKGIERWADRVNWEAHSPPLYYVVAGAWCRLGALLGIADGRLLYWVRFVNVIFAGLLVWASFAYSRVVYPERPELHVGVPLLAAFVPLDAAYVVNSDALAPLLGGLSLVAMAAWYRTAPTRVIPSVATGALAASSVLLKYSDAAIPIVFMALAAWKVRQASSRKALMGPALGIVTVLVVIGSLLVRNYVELGEVTGMSDKVRVLGWTRQGVAEMLRHPIFTPAGFAAFWTRLMQTLWRGELRWHLEPIAVPSADAFYVVSSSLLLVLSALGAASAATGSWRGTRAPVASATAIDWAVVSLSILCLVGLSVSFDYGECFYPSRDFPYLASGRLIGVALLPFLVLYVDGASQAFRRLTRFHVGATIAFAAATCIVIAASETAVTRPFLANEYNWFHLPEPTSYVATWRARAEQ